MPTQYIQLSNALSPVWKLTLFFLSQYSLFLASSASNFPEVRYLTAMSWILSVSVIISVSLSDGFNMSFIASAKMYSALSPGASVFSANCAAPMASNPSVLSPGFDAGDPVTGNTGLSKAPPSPIKSSATGQNDTGFAPSASAVKKP